MYVYAPHACLVFVCPWKSEEGIQCPGIGVTGGCAPPKGCLEQNQGPLREQLVLLAAETSLQSQVCMFFIQLPVS